MKQYYGKIRNDDSIFVNIASYRDTQCNETIQDMYKNAYNPQNIFIGICEQNKDSCESCLKENDYVVDGNIKKITLDHDEARGPCYARYLCSCLYNGENYYMQIDSHTRFVKHWDKKVVKMIFDTNDNSAVITHYPQPFDVTTGQTDPQRVNTIPKICSVKINDRNLIEFTAKEMTRIDNIIENKHPGLSAGFFFMHGRGVIDTPYDPNLDWLFQGEELLYAARLYTRGYNFYTPVENVLFHYYERKNSPRFWNDLRQFYRRERDQSRDTFNRILGLNSRGKPEIGTYGLGHNRSLEEYWNYLGFDPINRKVVKTHC